MLSLYEIADELRQLDNKLMEWAEEHDGDITDFPFAKEMEAIEGDMETKALNTAEYIKNLLAEAEAIKKEKKVLAARQSALEKKADKCKDYLQSYIPEGQKYKNARTVIGWRKSERLILDVEPDELPREYQKIEAKSADIKRDIKAGKDIDFAEIKKFNNISIK